MKSERFFFQLAVKPRQNFNPQPVPSSTQRDCAESLPAMFTLAPLSLSMVVKPWRNELRRGGCFFSAYQAMLSVNQQTIAGAQRSVAKPAPFLKPQNRVNFMSQNRSRCWGPPHLSWLHAGWRTCLKIFTLKPPIQTTQAAKPALVPDPFCGPNFGPQNEV